jgi:hypothetical protein
MPSVLLSEGSQFHRAQDKASHLVPAKNTVSNTPVVFNKGCIPPKTIVKFKFTLRGRVFPTYRVLLCGVLAVGMCASSVFIHISMAKSPLPCTICGGLLGFHLPTRMNQARLLCLALAGACLVLRLDCAVSVQCLTQFPIQLKSICSLP